MSLSLARHLIVAVPAAIGYALDHSGQLSVGMREILEVCTLAFGGAHVASVMHSAGVAKAQIIASGVADNTVKAGQNLEKLGALAQEFLAAMQKGSAGPGGAS